MRHEIIKVHYSGDDEPYWDYLDSFNEHEVIVSRNPSDATIEELCKMCDRKAESSNAHDFVGTHRLLGSLLFRNLGRVEATKVMLDISLYGGLSAMSGICTDSDAYGDLAVGEAGRDWDGEFA